MAGQISHKLSRIGPKEQEYGWSNILQVELNRPEGTGIWLVNVDIG